MPVQQQSSHNSEFWTALIPQFKSFIICSIIHTHYIQILLQKNKMFFVYIMQMFTSEGIVKNHTHTNCLTEARVHVHKTPQPLPLKHRQVLLLPTEKMFGDFAEAIAEIVRLVN